jgi:hypothetical protein
MTCVWASTRPDASKAGSDPMPWRASSGRGAATGRLRMVSLPGVRAVLLLPSNPAATLRHDFFITQQRIDEVLRVERAQVVDAFADPDESQRNRLP